VLFDHPRGYRLSEIVFPPPAFSEAGRAAAERRFRQMDVAVEAVVAANQAIFTPGQLGIVPDAVLGTARARARRCAAGMVDEVHNDQRVVELNDQHGQAEMAGDPPRDARLIAVERRASGSRRCARRGATACVAGIPPPSGHPDGGAAAASLFEGACATKGCERLASDRPHHTAQFSPSRDAAAAARAVDASADHPALLVHEHDRVSSAVAQARQLAFDHWIRPVEFRRTIERMREDGFRIFVESDRGATSRRSSTTSSPIVRLPRLPPT
jgi:hypothetical protein